MAAAVFRAKFTVPSLPADYRPRPRLDRLWRAWRQVKLIEVTAGPGWGKTCFLAGHARTLGDRVLWYTLDDLDRDPAVLTAHLSAACGLSVSPAPPLEQLAGIVGRLDRCRLLVLDDVQSIARADAARAILGRLLRYLPDDCRLVLAAREPIALAGARLQARGEAAGLSAQDLAMTPDETAAFLADRLGAGAAAPLAVRIHALTEGWPTGLEIVCQALAEGEPAARAEVLQRLAAGGGRWFDFFAEEVLAELDADTRRFLLLTATLPHLDREACERLTGRRDSAEVLADLARRGLFTVPVGDGAWRYHTLLRASLRHRLDRELSPAQGRRVRRRAASLLVRVGEVEAAALDLVRAGDAEGAGALLARNVRELTGTRRPETLALALADLPETQVRKEPALLLVRASLAQLHGRWDQAERDLRAALRSKPPSALAGSLQAHLVRLAMQRGRYEACLRAGRQALSRRTAFAPSDRGTILTAMGVAAASLGRLAEGAGLLQEALAIARRRRDPVLQGRCLFLLAANVHFIRGDLAEALRDARQARDLFAGLGRGDLACHAEGVLGFVLAGAGDQNRARQSSLSALQRAEAIGYRQIAGYARLTLGECDLLAEDPAAAAVRFGEAYAIAADLGEQALANWARLGLAESAWRLGDRKRAAAEVARSLDLATRRRDQFCLARALAQQGRLLAARNRAGAQARWSQAERLFQRLGARSELVRLRQWRENVARSSSPSSPSSPRTASRAAPTRRTTHAARTAVASVTEVEPLHLRLLGNLEIDRGSRPLVAGAWRLRRARRLLNMLLGCRLRPVPRDQLIESLWPESDPDKSVVNLRQAVFQLRRVLEPTNAGEPVHVISEGETLRLDIGRGGTCDLLLFEAALERARQARQAGRQPVEHAQLQEALALWRGPYLADTPYDPAVEDTASAVRHRFMRAAERLLELLTSRGAWDELVTLATRALAEDPLHEPFARSLLLGLLRLGHRQDARRLYAQFEARLVRDLDLLPSPALKELAEQASGQLP
ncbi:MAG: BTAD domain-containing putative transcriptional regulator [Candidatus Krumholzibacteria bacterium]|nr:BTAD domain-containing putative transcriptional regulator [Candidatus Krumholzibacteria bacterium]